MSGTSVRPRVVILGGGFAGLHAARTLRRAAVEVIVVDRTNHHLFQPLLYQVATAVLSPTDIAVPIRWRLRHQKNASVVLAAATRIDAGARVVHLDREPRELAYDYLVVATGARHAYFGNDGWEPVAPGLKSLEDAVEMRRRFLLAFERAEWAATEAERQKELTFVIVGGGPTGVELAGMIPPATRHTLRKEFRRVDTTRARVVLVEGGPRILPAMPESLSAAAKRQLEAIGVEVRLGKVVTKIERDAVYIGDERIATGTVFWAAGNAASPLGSQLGVPRDPAGRVHVTADLAVPGHRELFVVGDLCVVTEQGRTVPAVAPAAMQQGRCAALNIIRDLKGEPRRDFRYVNKGDLATIGRHRAVGSFGDGRLKVSGTIAWLLWLFIHIMYLAGFRNRASVMLQWGYSYFSFQRGARLIGSDDRTELLI